MILFLPKDRSTAFSDQCSNATGTPGVTPRGSAPLTTTIQGGVVKPTFWDGCFKMFQKLPLLQASHKFLYTKYTSLNWTPSSPERPDVQLSILGLFFSWEFGWTKNCAYTDASSPDWRKRVGLTVRFFQMFPAWMALEVSNLFSYRLSDWEFLPKWVFPKIGGKPPKSSILIGVSPINHPFWGTPVFGNTQIGMGP